MSGRVSWFPMSVAAWPVVLEALVAAGPLSEELALDDLAYLADRAEYAKEPRPAVAALAKRWGRSRSFARRLLAMSDRWKGRARKDRRRTGEGQAKDTAGTAAERKNANNEAEKDTQWTGEGQAKDTQGTGEDDALRDTRAPTHTPHPSPTPTPVEGSCPAPAAATPTNVHSAAEVLPAPSLPSPPIDEHVAEVHKHHKALSTLDLRTRPNASDRTAIRDALTKKGARITIDTDDDCDEVTRNATPDELNRILTWAWRSGDRDHIRANQNGPRTLFSFKQNHRLQANYDSMLAWEGSGGFSGLVGGGVNADRPNTADQIRLALSDLTNSRMEP